MNTPQVLPTRSRLSARQRNLQCRTSQLPFKVAVWLAADTLFDFTHRRTHGKALWCDAASVWLGSKTFLEWAMNSAEYDVPRMVAETPDAPQSAKDLRGAVHGELLAYWADCLASLPSKSTPRWQPLP